MWIIPVEHNNLSSKNKELREKFSKALVSTAKLHNEVICLPLKQKWSKNESSLFDRATQDLTTAGSITIWESLDRTLKYADTIVDKNPDRPLHDLFYQQKRALFSVHDFSQPGRKFTTNNGIERNRLINNSNDGRKENRLNNPEEDEQKTTVARHKDRPAQDARKKLIF